MPGRAAGHPSPSELQGVVREHAVDLREPAGLPRRFGARGGRGHAGGLFLHPRAHAHRHGPHPADRADPGHDVQLRRRDRLLGAVARRGRRPARRGPPVRQATPAAHRRRRRELLERGDARRDDPGSPARRRLRHAGRLPPVAADDGPARHPGHPAHDAAPLVLLHRAARLQHGPPEQPALPPPGHRPARQRPARAAGPLRRGPDEADDRRDRRGRRRRPRRPAAQGGQRRADRRDRHVGCGRLGVDDRHGPGVTLGHPAARPHEHAQHQGARRDGPLCHHRP